MCTQRSWEYNSNQNTDYIESFIPLLRELFPEQFYETVLYSSSVQTVYQEYIFHFPFSLELFAKNIHDLSIYLFSSCPSLSTQYTFPKFP